MVSNNGLNPPPNCVRSNIINDQPDVRKDNNIARMGPNGWIEHIKEIITESGLDIHNNAIDPNTSRSELLSLFKDLYKLIDVSKRTFEGEPSINDLCRKLNKIALALVFKFTEKTNRANEHLLILGSNDKHSKLNQLPKELVDLIAKNIFEAKLKESIDSFKAIQ